MRQIPASRAMMYAKHQVQENENFRLWPVYAAVLAGFMHVLHYWPVDMLYIVTMAENPWTIDLSEAVMNCGAALAVLIGLVGLMRRSWLARVLSLYAIGFGYFHAISTGSWLQMLWLDVSWFLYGSAAADIHAIAGNGTPLSAVLQIVYFGGVMAFWYLVARRVFPQVKRFEARWWIHVPRAGAVVRSWL